MSDRPVRMKSYEKDFAVEVPPLARVINRVEFIFNGEEPREAA